MLCHVVLWLLQEERDTHSCIYPALTVDSSFYDFLDLIHWRTRCFQWQQLHSSKSANTVSVRKTTLEATHVPLQSKNTFVLSTNGRGNVNLVVLTFFPRRGCYMGLGWFFYLLCMQVHILFARRLTVRSINCRVSLVIFYKYWQNVVFHKHPYKYDNFFSLRGSVALPRVYSRASSTLPRIPFFHLQVPIILLLIRNPISLEKYENGSPASYQSQILHAFFFFLLIKQISLISILS